MSLVSELLERHEPFQDQDSGGEMEIARFAGTYASDSLVAWSEFFTSYRATRAVSQECRGRLA